MNAKEKKVFAALGGEDTTYLYDGVEYCGKWRDFDVYAPILKKEYECAIIGEPYFILVKNGKTRLTTPEETDECLDYFPSYDEAVA